MGMSFAYGGVEESQAIKTLHAAVDMGVTFLDTAEVYGPYDNELLIGKAIKGIRDKVQIATKFGFRILPNGHGIERMAGVDSRPHHIREASKDRFNGFISTPSIYFINTGLIPMFLWKRLWERWRS